MHPRVCRIALRKGPAKSCHMLVGRVGGLLRSWRLLSRDTQHDQWCVTVIVGVCRCPWIHHKRRACIPVDRSEWPRESFHYGNHNKTANLCRLWYQRPSHPSDVASAIAGEKNESRINFVHVFVINFADNVHARQFCIKYVVRVVCREDYSDLWCSLTSLS